MKKIKFIICFSLILSFVFPAKAMAFYTYPDPIFIDPPKERWFKNFEGKKVYGVYGKFQDDPDKPGYSLYADDIEYYNKGPRKYKLIDKDFVVEFNSNYYGKKYVTLMDYVGDDEEVVIPKPIDKIDHYSFYNRVDKVKKIVLGKHVKYLHHAAFEGLYNLEEVVIENPDLKFMRDFWFYKPMINTKFIDDGSGGDFRMVKRAFQSKKAPSVMVVKNCPDEMYKPMKYTPFEGTNYIFAYPTYDHENKHEIIVRAPVNSTIHKAIERMNRNHVFVKLVFKPLEEE